MEELLCIIWQQRIYTRISVAPHIELEIIDPGIRNYGYGPDFLNAKLKVGEKQWTGHVVMHIHSTDWYRYNHDKDTNFNQVILLVVQHDDNRVVRQDGCRIMQLALPVTARHIEKSNQLLTIKYNQSHVLSCYNRLREVPRKTIADWMNALAIERMTQKVRRVESLINDQPESWKEAFYIILSRAFGTGRNSEAFELLARSLPYRYIQQHIDQPIQIYALLFGQAGFLEDELPEEKEIYKEMRREYAHLRDQYKLRPMPEHTWQYNIAHPAATPPHRLASLAALLYSRGDLFEQVCAARDLTTLTKVLRAPLYTQEENQIEFLFDLGEGTTNSLIINAVVPILLAYSRATDNRELRTRALNFLHTLPAESNRYIYQCQDVGLCADNAYHTQAMLQLCRNYCEERMCLRCQIGQWIITH